MTRAELRDYVDEQRTLNNIPYHVYSTLIDGIDTLEQEPTHMVDKSNFSKEQYKADLQSAYDCGFEAGKKANQEPVLEIKTVTNAKEAEAYPINENIIKGFEEFTKMMFKQGQAQREPQESEDKE